MSLAKQVLESQGKVGKKSEKNLNLEIDEIEDEKAKGILLKIQKDMKKLTNQVGNDLANLFDDKDTKLTSEELAGIERFWIVVTDFTEAGQLPED